jgi:hypothetical protein
MDNPSKIQSMDWGGATVVLSQPWSTSHWIGWLPWDYPACWQRGKREESLSHKTSDICTGYVHIPFLLMPKYWSLWIPEQYEHNFLHSLSRSKLLFDMEVRYFYSVHWHLLFGSYWWIHDLLSVTMWLKKHHLPHDTGLGVLTDVHMVMLTLFHELFWNPLCTVSTDLKSVWI